MGKQAKPSLRKARLHDAEQMHALIAHYARRREMMPRALNDIYENIRDYTVIASGNNVLACGALHVVWKDMAEIRSLAVKPRHTKKSYGIQLVRSFLKEARDLRVDRVFALTFQPDFFLKCDFRVVDREALPKKVWYECVKCVHFPDCDEVAVLMEI